MNGTPRLKSAFPATPRTERRAPASRLSNGSATLKSSQDETNAPLVPLSWADAPQQRAYVFGLYIALTGWRCYDYYGLIADDTQSFWLTLKWIFIDSAFLFGVPELRIPWLDWSPTAVLLLVVAHIVGNAILMLRIPIPFEAWLVGFTKMIWDSEMAISERKVKAASLLHNSSLILGKQIVHILPEG